MKCRTVEIEANLNELFLQFCVNYHTPDRERYREIYERAVEREEALASGTVPSLATESDHVLRS